MGEWFLLDQDYFCFIPEVLIKVEFASMIGCNQTPTQTLEISQKKFAKNNIKQLFSS